MCQAGKKGERKDEGRVGKDKQGPRSLAIFHATSTLARASHGNGGGPTRPARVAVRTCWRSIPLKRGILRCPHSAPDCLPNSTMRNAAGLVQGKTGLHLDGVLCHSCQAVGSWQCAVGRTFGKQCQTIGNPEGDEGWPSRSSAVRVLTKLLNLGNRQAARLPTGDGCLTACSGGLAQTGVTGRPKRPGYQIISLIAVETIKVLKSPFAAPRFPGCPFPPLPLIRLFRLFVPSSTQSHSGIGRIQR
jgi:hypothetical protein